jgi:hypothetical protein
MWKKPENPTACGGDEWQAGVWGWQPPRAFSLEEAPPLAAGFFTSFYHNKFSGMVSTTASVNRKAPLAY